MIQSKFDNLVSRYFSFMVVTYPLLVMYSFIHVKLEYLFFLVGFFLFIIKGQNSGFSFKTSKSLLSFFFYMSFVPSLIYVLIVNHSGNMLQTGTIFFFVTLCLILDNAKIDYIWKYYFYILWIAVVIFLLQELMWYTIGSRFSALIPGLEFTFYDNMTSEDMASFQVHTNRSCSIFMEPAVFAKYLIPAVVYNLGCSKKKIINFLGLSIVLILLRSGVGLILLLTCFILLLFQLPYKNRITRIIAFCFLIVISLFIGLKFTVTEYGSEQMMRINELNGDSDNVSGFQRIVRGYLLYDGLSIFEKIFGIGTKNIGAAILSSPYKIFFDGSSDVYLNGIQAILVGGGLIGLFLFGYMLFKIWDNDSTINKGIILCMTLTFFIAAEYLSATMLLFITIAILIKYHPHESCIQNIGRR